VFRLRLPLTLAIIKAILFRVEHRLYASSAELGGGDDAGSPVGYFNSSTATKSLNCAKKC